MHTQCKVSIAGKVIIRNIVALVLLPFPRWLQTTYDAIHEMAMGAEVVRPHLSISFSILR